MPLPLLAAYAGMLPRLESAEALDAAVVAFLPHISQEDRQSQLRQWRDGAGGRVVLRAKSREELLDRAATYGVGVQRVPKA